MTYTCVMPRLALAGLLALAPPAAAADPPPIPYDAKKAQALRDQQRAWILESTLGAYKAVGRRSPKWDRPVEQAMKVNVERLAGPDWMRIPANAEFADLVRKAVEAGCDDPLVRYYAARFRRRDTDATTKREFREAAKALAASKYPGVRKAHAWLNAVAELQFAPPKEERNEADLEAARECLDELLKLLPAVARDRNRFLRKEVVELCRLVHRNGHDIGQRKEWFDRLEREVLAKLPKDDPLPDLVAGEFLVEWAWDARGTGLASTVTEEGGRLFQERLGEADKRLRRAWERDKQGAEAATLQISVCTGLGHDRDTMEVWFRRAVEADPNHVGAFFDKANYLQPKWHGGADEVLDFARQVVKLGRWDTTLPLLLTQVHYDLGASSGKKFVAYFRELPEVWAEIEPVLEEIRKRYPKSPLGASQYLYFAWGSDRNPERPREYVGAVVGGLAKGPFRNREETTAAREWAARGAGKAKKE